MCLFYSVLALFGPRLAVLIWWIIRPGYYMSVFQTWVWPFLGLIFAPWTTLMYLLVYGNNGIVGFDWVWVGLAVLFDLATYGGSAYGNRERIPGYSGN